MVYSVSPYDTPSLRNSTVEELAMIHEQNSKQKMFISNSCQNILLNHILTVTSFSCLNFFLYFNTFLICIKMLILFLMLMHDTLNCN